MKSKAFIVFTGDKRKTYQYPLWLVKLWFRKFPEYVDTPTDEEITECLGVYDLEQIYEQRVREIRYGWKSCR